MNAQSPLEDEHRFRNSEQLKLKAQALIAGFTQSMMKKPEQFCEGRFPVYLNGGEGAEVIDVDEHRYIDYICGLGANMLGHNHPVIVEAIQSSLQRGIIHSLPAPVEIDVAEILCDMIPGAERVRFFKTGADANSAAVRLARHITGKQNIITIGYNGWHDQYMFDTPGVPEVIAEYTQRMPLFRVEDEAPLLELIEQQGERLAAVLISLPYTRQVSGEFMRRLRDVCSAQHVLLIMDEVVTGFRLALGGAQEYYQVQADLVTLSKSLAGGMPLSAITGPAELMEPMAELQVSTTFGGEMLSLEVCKAVLLEYQRSGYIEHIHRLGAQLKQGINAAAEQLEVPLRVVGYDPVPMFMFDRDMAVHAGYAEIFLGEMAERGVLLRRDVNFICALHTQPQIAHTIDAASASLYAMRERGVFDTQGGVD